MPKTKKQLAHVIAVDMGYGHQRAADPLREIAYGGKVINANAYVGIPAEDKKIWHDSQRFYNFISRFKKVPVIGEIAFNLFDKFQEIPSFYPHRDLSDSNIQLKYMMHLIKTQHWGMHLIQKLEKHPLPLITTFFVVGFMAEMYRYSGDIYVVATDTDISRTWVPIDPEKSRIHYFAPTKRAAARLKRYGVRSERIHLTGFPLPNKLLGDNLKTLKSDLKHRLVNLDPDGLYRKRFNERITQHLGLGAVTKPTHPLTLMFTVGGAGAQRELGVDIVRSLKLRLRRDEIRVLLMAGTHRDIAQYFQKEVKKLGLEKELGTSVKVLFSSSKEKYFQLFNRVLRETDILWSKPSEISFYTALGLPIVMSPPIGSQEKFNRQWLFKIGSGVEQEDPRYTDEWLFDLLDSGWFADAAMQGYLEAPKFGVASIKKVLEHKSNGTTLELKTEMQY